MGSTALIAVSFVAALGIGVPVAIALGIAALTGLYLADMPLEYLAQNAYSAVDSFTVIAIPMFILAGALMERGQLTDRLIDLSRAIVGRAPGGLATVTIMACTLFAAISGSGPATTAAIGSIMIPAMVRDGYKRSFSCGVAASAGGIGVVIPPSIPMIIYGVTAETSITALFVAGVIPGLILALALYAVAKVISHRRGYSSPAVEGARGPRIWAAFLAAKWSLLAPVVILGGIYTGVFTVTEASVAGVVYALVIGFLVHRTLTFADLIDSLVATARIAGTVLIVLATGLVFGRILALYQVPQDVSGWLTQTFTDRTALILMIALLLLFIGMWMETITQIVILTPLLLPAVVATGMDPIQFGVMFVIACELGFQTPPLGVNLFVAGEIAGAKIEEVTQGVVPFVIAGTVVLLLVGFIPELSLWLPRELGYIR
ncbi:TRAP transporter large permease [Azospirillum sp. RWY-5-1]|uniref:TRAP transporter large permease protein n=1 Tax=Azospirillum oleiclasticum TaxID=2735135 RepID=A0ABX2T8R6_9PROT|nr:TRAP transporter large permease [Azospirillum oleiclasticum]NYZ12466.1 TRAP transporter large permease [Azospirillum oleiclasticum]NYZ19626.1 TRAP transporter large permease [Azospirillum oleiclasticum]